MPVAETQSPDHQAVGCVVVVPLGVRVGEVVPGEGVETQETDSEIGERDVGCDEGIVGVHAPQGGGNSTVDELEGDGGSLRATQ